MTPCLIGHSQIEHVWKVGYERTQNIGPASDAGWIAQARGCLSSGRERSGLFIGWGAAAGQELTVKKRGTWHRGVEKGGKAFAKAWYAQDQAETEPGHKGEAGRVAGARTVKRKAVAKNVKRK